VGRERESDGARGDGSNNEQGLEQRIPLYTSAIGRAKAHGPTGPPVGGRPPFFVTNTILPLFRSTYCLNFVVAKLGPK
jgi:hypothetical protein